MKNIFSHKNRVKWVILTVLIITLLLPMGVLAESDNTQSMESLVFLGNQNLPPMVYLENGLPKGIVVDIVHALAVKMGRTIEIKVMNWAEAQKIVEQGGADALIQINTTEERKKIYDFSDPLLDSKFSIFTLTDTAGISGVADLRGLRVGVEAKGYPSVVLQSDSLIELMNAPCILDAFHMLKDGSIDAVVADEWVGEYILAKNGIDGVLVADDPIATLQSSIAVQKGDTELLAAINKGLTEIKEDGTYQQILDNWKPAEVVFQTRDQIRLTQYQYIFVALIIAVIFAVVWWLLLFRQFTKTKRMKLLLEEEHRQLTDTIIGTKIGTWEWNVQTGETVFDARWADIIGYTPEELSSSNMDVWKGYIHPEDLEKSETQLNMIIDKKADYFDVEYRMKHKAGHWVWVNIKGKVISWTTDGRPLLMSGMSIDITDRKHSEEAIKESEAKYRLLTENASDVIWVFNLSKNEFEYISPAIFFLRGITQEEAMHQSLEESMTPESFVVVKDAIAKRMDSVPMNPGVPDYLVMEIQQPCKNGGVIWVEISTKSRLNSEGQIEIVGISRNIEERRKAQAESLYLSYHDQLTGLYNRRFYEEELDRLDTENNLPLTIAMGDVNGLKLINDSFGHAAGDELLKRVAEVIRKGCREGDILARLGGDEFSIILPQTNAVEAGKVLDRIKDLLSEEKAGAIGISISFGYETKNNGNEDVQEIIKKTEDHMYRHKIYESSSMRSRTIDLIMNTLFEKNDREMLHSKRVSEICEAIANKMDFDKDDVNQIRIAGLMHDIGKIGIDEKILNTPQALDDDDWKEIKKHPEIGYRILNSVTEFSEIAGDILAHHERWDGTGYPKGLKGEEIPLRARIIAIADSYDAMTVGRAYKAARSEDATAEEIRRCSGTQFDPEIAKIFIAMVLKSELGCDNSL